MAAAKKRLGRGLGGLIGGGGKTAPAKKASAKKTSKVAEAAAPEPSKNGAPTLEGYQEIPVSAVTPNPYQPRRAFSEEAIAELADSIQSEGLLQPIVVRAQSDGHFQLVAGERRWRAVQRLKLKKIPARVIQASDVSSAVVSLIENLQRENLNPMDEALGYASLLRDFDLTQEGVAERVGKSRASVANALRLVKLDGELQQYLARGTLSVGHAKVLLGVEDGSQRLVLARQAIEQGWSVRDLEQKIARGAVAGRTKSRRTVPAAERAAIDDLQKRLSTRLSTKVQVQHNPKRGKLVIEYHGNEDLQRILEFLGLEEG